MKLYKLTYETEIFILAEDEKEAIINAKYYVSEETPELVECDAVEDMNQIPPNWKGAIPYSAQRHYNVEEKLCEEFVK